MILFPAVDILDGRSVRLLHGKRDAVTDYGDPVERALRWAEAGAKFLHVVDLNGAFGDGDNAATIARIVRETSLPVQVGGGIKSVDRAAYYIEEAGAERVIVGSAIALDPGAADAMCARFGRKIVAGIDVKDGFVAVKGWVEKSTMTALQAALAMKEGGSDTVVYTDISRDGDLSGVNAQATAKLGKESGMNIIASGGVSSLLDIVSLYDLGLYGAIAGKSLYTGALDLRTAIIACHKISGKNAAGDMPEDELDLYFTKSDLLPAIIQDDDTNEVLMLAYMNRESFRKSLETGYTWFYSRSRKTLWNKGETSGHTQKIVSVFSDCDDDTLLIRVKQKGPACHTGSHSCFFKRLRGEESPKGE